jgi:DNA-3-methyladenine glycosylase II
MIGPATALAEGFPYFASCLARNGVPPLWKREPGFASLVHIILEQQVSLASAQAAFDRLVEVLGEVTAEAFLDVDADEARTIGFSRQKYGYCSGIARRLIDDPTVLSVVDLPDTAALDQLCRLRGVGPWTATVYLMFAGLRADMWPHGDRALVVSMQKVLKLNGVPTYTDADAIAESWSPHRTTAARMLWHDYLGGVDYSRRHGITSIYL